MTVVGAVMTVVGAVMTVVGAAVVFVVFVDASSHLNLSGVNAPALHINVAGTAV